MREPVTTETLNQAAEVVRSTLQPALAEDWSVAAGYLTWDCRTTLDHIVDTLGIYAGRLATQAPGPQPRFRNGDPNATLEDLLEALRIGSALLGAVATVAPDGARAWHRMGMGDAEGFLAMACEEMLGHTYDITQGLNRAMVVPEDLAGRFVQRLFPWAPVECGRWEAFLWCSNRIALPERGHIGKWGLWSAPLSEWPGGDGPPATWPTGF